MYPISDHFDGKRFFNPWGANVAKSLLDVLKWKLGGGQRAWPPSPPPDQMAPRFHPGADTATTHVTYIGHATTYLQSPSLSVLTDPQFSLRASPLRFAGPKRFRPPALHLEELPGVDAVVISHNHYDHLDLPTLAALQRKFKPTFIVPLGNAKLLTETGLKNLVELDWWQSHEGVQLVPAQHWSARSLRDRNQALWGGFVLHMDGRKIFFAGDTGYGPHFKWIQDRLGAMDLSLLPIGAYEPRSFMKEQHMNPKDAMQAHFDLGSKQSFAIHYETFRLTDEGYHEPRQWLERLKLEHNLAPPDFLLPRIGETLVLP